jgi:hypothetical protein
MKCRRSIVPGLATLPVYSHYIAKPCRMQKSIRPLAVASGEIESGFAFNRNIFRQTQRERCWKQNLKSDQESFQSISLAGMQIQLLDIPVR